MNGFNARFPGATAKWETEVGNTLKAEFLQDGQEVESWFSADGIWLRTEVDLLLNALPKVVTTAVETHYPGYSIDDADWIETKDSGSYYELELEKAWIIQETPEGTLYKLQERRPVFFDSIGLRTY